MAAPNIGEPSGARIALDAASKPENRIAAFGVAKYTIESRPWCRVRVRVRLEDRPSAWERAGLSVRIGVRVRIRVWAGGSARDLVEAKDATRAHGVFYDIHGALLLGRQLQHCLGELNLCREVLAVWKVFVVVGMWRWQHGYEGAGLGGSPGKYSRSPRHH